jgi:3'-phosphoadenosine 5'-phosphosulfate sulfotransferase (PAPS reductase)/FAD synthetase
VTPPFSRATGVGDSGSLLHPIGSLEPFPSFKANAERIVIDAIVEHEPSKVFVLFSGGGDSSVLLSWARINFGRRIDAAVFIDTGTALPGVREFVETFCVNRYIPLFVLEAGDAYARMVRKHGIPGPGAHLYPYVWLKERQLDKLVREQKAHRTDRILLLTGARRAESTRRMGTAVPIKRDGSTVWANPLIDWTNADMRAYRDHHQLEQSTVAALMHRSGECNCGAFAKPGERDELRSLWPTWFEATIAPLERDAAKRGLPCVWGQRQSGDDSRVGPMCQGCAAQMELEEAA